MARITLHSDSGYHQHIRVRDHHWEADEGPALGGQDQGPNPYELFLSGLGACTAITLRMYAERKGWELGEMDVALHFHRDDDGHEQIDRTLRCSAPLSEEQRQRLLEIAAKTPVTLTVKRGTPVATQWAAD